MVCMTKYLLLGGGVILTLVLGIYFLWAELDKAKERFARLDAIVDVYKDTNDRMIQTMEKIRDFENYLTDIRTEQNKFQNQVLEKLDTTTTVYIDRVKTDEETKVWDSLTIPLWIQEKNRLGGSK